MVDFHSHFLPGIDDGADSVECALEMLADLKKQKVSTVVSSSHYYETRGSIEEFLQQREISYNKLRCAMEKQPGDYPDIILGAEVALTPDIPKMDGLEKLCIGNTNNILLELPYTGYYEWIIYAVYDIIAKRNLVPVLAHFERFCINKNALEQFKSILDLDVKVQINTESLLYSKSFKIVKYLYKMDAIDVIGSDAHNMSTRKSTFAEGVKRIEKKFGKSYMTELNNNAKNLIGLI